MPIVRLPHTWIYFAHVPKCAGTAVEHYLTARFGPLGLHDPSFALRGPGEGWSVTAPQHMPEAVRREVLPDTLFGARFATVRHPATRLRAAFLFQREVARTLPPKMSFQRWLEIVPRSLALGPYHLDGHLRPMVDFVPEGAAVFRIEDGLDAVVDWLDTQAGDSDGPRVIAPANVLIDRVGKVENIAMTPQALDQVATLYAADFARFGYPVDPAEMETTP